MNKDEFVKIINALIDARLKKILPVLLKREMDALRKEISTGTVGIPDEINVPELANALAEDLIRPKVPVKSSPKIPPKTYTKDSKLNAVLQQTANELKSGNSIAGGDESLSEYKKLLSEQYENSGEMETLSFGTQDLPSIANKTALAQRRVSPEIEKEVALQVGQKQIEAMTGNPELGSLIMRDYRNLMKKVDAKVKSERPSV